MLSSVFFPNKCVNRGIRQSCVYSSNEGSLEILGAHSIYRSKEIESIYQILLTPFLLVGGGQFEPEVFFYITQKVLYLRLLTFSDFS